MTEAFVHITPLHIVYLLGVVVILVTMAFRKDTLLPCLVFLFMLGVMATGRLTGGVQTLYNAVLYAGRSFMDIIVTISLVVALSKCLADLGSDYLMMKPGFAVMRTPIVSFWVLGFSMLLFSLFLWPSPSVALVGAIMLPVAISSGLKPIYAAMAMNIFGHGIALSYDFVIQGAPAVTANAAGISPTQILQTGRPLFIIMAIVTVLAAFILNRKNMTKYQLEEKPNEPTNSKEPVRTYGKTAKFIAIATPIAFALDIVAMLIVKLKGGDATSLVAGTAVTIMCVGSILFHGKDSLEKITDYVRSGFLFGIKIFAPVIIIGAFFFMGGEAITEIFPNLSLRGGIMNDWAKWISATVPMQKYAVAAMQMTIGAVTGLDGSGFSGLPLVGGLAATFSQAVHIDTAILATLGQISAIWVGGGVIIPWGLIPVAAICGVDPQEMARKNFWPVMIGFGATLLVAFILI